MKGTKPSVTVEAGRDCEVIDHGPNHTTVRLENAVVAIHGRIDERRAVVEKLAEAVGLRTSPALEVVR